MIFIFHSSESLTLLLFIIFSSLLCNVTSLCFFNLENDIDSNQLLKRLMSLEFRYDSVSEETDKVLDQTSVYVMIVNKACEITTADHVQLTTVYKDHDHSVMSIESVAKTESFALERLEQVMSYLEDKTDIRSV